MSLTDLVVAVILWYLGVLIADAEATVRVILLC